MHLEQLQELCWELCSALPREHQQPGTPGKEPKHLNWPQATTIQGKKTTLNETILHIFQKKEKSFKFSAQKEMQSCIYFENFRHSHCVSHP